MQSIEAVQFESLFDERLKMYDVDVEGAKQEEEEQQEIFKRLREANVSFVAAKKGDTSSKQREQALQALENAYFKYKEIISNLETGRKFYNDLAKIVTRFRDDCRNHAYQRRAEAQQIENDITTSMAGLSLQQPPPLQQQQHQQQQQQQAASAQQNLHYQQNPPFMQHANAPPAPAEEPLAAPTPTRHPGPSTAGMWMPEMGIKFSSPGGGGAPPAGGNGAGQKQPQDSRWNPAGGLKFG